MRKLVIEITYETRRGDRDEQELEVEQAMLAAVEKHLLDMPEAYSGNNASGPICYITDVQQTFARPIEYAVDKL